MLPGSLPEEPSLGSWEGVPGELPMELRPAGCTRHLSRPSESLSYVNMCMKCSYSPPCFQNNSVSPSESLRASEKHRGSADYSMEAKKRKAEEKDSLSRYVCLRARRVPPGFGLGGLGWGRPHGA